MQCNCPARHSPQLGRPDLSPQQTSSSPAPVHPLLQKLQSPPTPSRSALAPTTDLIQSCHDSSDDWKIPIPLGTTLVIPPRSYSMPYFQHKGYDSSAQRQHAMEHHGYLSGISRMYRKALSQWREHAAELRQIKQRIAWAVARWHRAILMSAWQQLRDCCAALRRKKDLLARSLSSWMEQATQWAWDRWRTAMTGVVAAYHLLCVPPALLTPAIYSSVSSCVCVSISVNISDMRYTQSQ